MKHERIAIPMILLVLIALLAGLVGWRLLHFGTEASWAELVRGAPKDVIAARDAIAKAESVVDDALEAGVESTLMGTVQRQVDEVAQLSDDLLTIDHYLVPKDPSLQPQSGAVDPLNEILVDPTQEDGLDAYTVEYPGDFRDQLKTFRSMQKNLVAATGHLTELTTSLRTTLDAETASAHRDWEDARKALQDSVTEAETAIEDASEQTYFPEDEDHELSALEKQVSSATALLQENPNPLAKLTDVAGQTAEFTAASDALKKKTTALEKAVEDRLLAVALEEEAAAEEEYEDPVYQGNDTTGTTEEPTDDTSTGTNNSGAGDTGTNNSGAGDTGTTNPVPDPDPIPTAEPDPDPDTGSDNDSNAE